MPHIVKISQRRKGSGAQVRFQSRSFIDSDTSEKVDGMRRIQWTACVGFGGRHGSDSVDGMRRITHSESSESLRHPTTRTHARFYQNLLVQVHLLTVRVGLMRHAI